MKKGRPMRVAILMADGFEESEFRHPVETLCAARHEAVVVGPRPGAVLVGKKMEQSVAVDLDVHQASPAEFDGLVIPGGYSPDRLRIVSAAVAFTAEMHAAGRLVATICHGPWLLIEAGLVRERHLTGWSSVRTDVLNAGGLWTDAPVVIDGSLVTSRAPADLPYFSEAILAALAAAGRGVA
jgi:protease I